MKKFILALVAMSVFTTAQAAFLIEPYVGYNFNSELEANNCSSNCTDDVSGTSIGARIGWQSLGLQLGGSVKLSQLEIDGDDASGKSLGVFVGYELPILFRVWAEYTLSSTLEDDDSGVELTDGSGFTIGGGYTGLPFVAINLEFSKVNYEKFEAGSVSGSLDADLNTMLLSVSLPLTF